MKKLILTIAVFPVFLMLLASNTNEMLVSFAPSDWDASSQKAKTEGKLYFVDFDASYCATCRHMDQTTYTNTELADYMRQNVVAKRIDVQDFDGVMWSQEYEIEALPTMLVFNKDGKLIKRLVGYKSATELIQEFEQAKGAVLPQPMSSDEPMPAPVAKETPAAFTVPLPEEKETPVTKKEQTEDFFSNKPLVPVTTKKDALYEIDVRKKTSAGYAVQVGAFASYTSFMKEAERLTNQFNVKALLHVENNAVAPIYKLLLGNFLTKHNAQVFVRQLKKNKIEGLVKDLSKIQQ